MLKGEVEPLKVELKDYTIVEKDGQELFEFTEVETSREWINILIETFVKDKSNKIEIPQEYAKLIKMVL